MEIEKYDIVIAGAGLFGSVIAERAANKGLKVIVIESLMKKLVLLFINMELTSFILQTKKYGLILTTSHNLIIINIRF